MESTTELLAYWINERYNILRRRRAGEPKPWTEDRIFRTVRFCNVHREDDKVTEWIRNNWRDENWGHPNLVTAMVLARMVNRPETLQNIGFPHSWDSKSIKNILNGSPPPVFGNAYLITTCGKRMDKVDYVVDWVCQRVQDAKFYWSKGTSLKQAHEQLMRIDGLGSFLAAQVIADLKNTPNHALQFAADWHDFSAPGPGSLKGLTYYHRTQITPVSYYWAIRKAFEEVGPFVHPTIPPTHMQDFQNCLCEFSKYMRVRDGGRAKNGYPG